MSANLSIRALSKRYESATTEAVVEFSLEVKAGEFVTLLGPSGSGKTTILKMIAGFERPTAGEIFVDSAPITELPPYQRGVGMVFQNYALFPHMTVFENIAFPLSVRSASRAEVASKVADALKLVRLEGLESRYPLQLSGGQQQRVALARAVVFNPTLLLMDEPLGALDRNLRESMKYEIKRVQDELDMTVVYVTHDQDEALAMSDRICVIHNGRLIQVGTARELYDLPNSSFVARFVGESNLLAGKLIREQNGTWFEMNGGITIPVRSPPPDHPASCLLLIRPERIRVVPRTAGDEETWFGGRVTKAVFLGDTTRYQIEAGALTLTVKQQNVDGHFFPVGTDVSVGWKREAATLLHG